MSNVEHRVKYLTVEITKDKMTKIVVTIPQWEAQVVVALWGDEAQIIGESFEMRTLPEANSEFTRLANKYGPRDEDVPVVAKVYGSFGPGLRALEQEFAASTMSISTQDDVPEVTEDIGGATRKDGDGIVAITVPGVQLPGSDKTFGPDAVPEVKDDIPALAGNMVTINGEVKPLEEALSDVAETAAEFDDLTGEGEVSDDSSQVE